MRSRVIISGAIVIGLGLPAAPVPISHAAAQAPQQSDKAAPAQPPPDADADAKAPAAVPQEAPAPVSTVEEAPLLIRISSPASNEMAVNYLLNGTRFTIQPGEKQELPADRQWIIEFDRGGQFGKARYTLQMGVSVFTPTAKGWELYNNPWPTFVETYPCAFPRPPLTGRAPQSAR